MENQHIKKIKIDNFPSHKYMNNNKLLILDDYKYFMKEPDETEKKLICSNPNCKSTEMFYVNKIGQFRKQNTGEQVFLLLTTDTKHKPIGPIKLQESIMIIWGCESCKSLTYTNCTIERTDDYSESKLIDIR